MKHSQKALHLPSSRGRKHWLRATPPAEIQQRDAKQISRNKAAGTVAEGRKSIDSHDGVPSTRPASARRPLGWINAPLGTRISDLFVGQVQAVNDDSALYFARNTGWMLRNQRIWSSPRKARQLKAARGLHRSV